MKIMYKLIFVFLLISNSLFADETSNWLKEEIDNILNAYQNHNLSNVDRYNYIDGQLSMMFLGIGFGRIGKKTKTAFYNSNGRYEEQITYEEYSKTKFWIGSVILLSYDYISSPNGRHNFGVFGVAPIPLNPDY